MQTKQLLFPVYSRQAELLLSPRDPYGNQKHQAEQRFCARINFLKLGGFIIHSLCAKHFFFFFDERLIPLMVSPFTQPPLACYSVLTLGSYPGWKRIAISPLLFRALYLSLQRCGRLWGLVHPRDLWEVGVGSIVSVLLRHAWVTFRLCNLKQIN